MPTKIPESEFHQSIRGYFAGSIYNCMVDDDKIWLITGDLGWGMLDRIRDDFPDRFCNCGASEQLALGIGVGLALSGFKPFVYSITTFLIYRPFEWLRNYLNHENIPVILVGSGWDKDYEHDGISHQPFEAGQVLDCLPNIQQLYPDFKEELPFMVNELVANPKPSFLCLRR